MIGKAKHYGLGVIAPIFAKTNTELHILYKEELIWVRQGDWLVVA